MSSPLAAAGRPDVGHVMLSVGTPSETFIVQAIAATVKQGWPAQVFGLHRDGQLPALPSERVLIAPRPPALSRAIARLARLAPEERFARQMRAEAERRGVGLLHAHFGWAAEYALPLAQSLDVPLVVTFYGSDALVQDGPSARGGSQRDPRYERVFAQASAVIAVSEYVESALRRAGYRGSVHMIRNGLDLTQLPFIPPSGTPPAAPRLLFVGRLIPFKGTDVLIRAMSAVLRRHPDARLEIVGDGPQRSQLEHLAANTGAGHAVRFIGLLTHDQVFERMRRSDLLVVPSRLLPDGSTDSSSMVFKEGLALGLPVIATRVGGLVETCPPEFRSELVPPDDPQGLAEQISAVLAEPNHWPERAGTGRAWVEGTFSAEELGRQLSTCYQNVLAQA